MLLYLSDGYLQGMLLWLIGGGISFWLLLRMLSIWRARPKRLKWIQAGLSMWMTLALLTGIELYFALIYDQSDSFNLTNVSKKWFALHADPQRRKLVVSDRPGEEIEIAYRDDRVFPESLQPDQRHLVFFGDSFTFAQGVNDVRDRFSNRVRAALEPASGGKIVVSNLSDAGTDLRWIKAVLEGLLKNGHKIDTAVYVMCLNDVETYHENHARYYQNLSRHNPQFFLFRDTYFFNWMYFRLKQYTSPEVRSYYSFVKEYYADGPWQFMRDELLELHRFCRSHNTDLRVVIFPFLHNLGPNYPFREVHQNVSEELAKAGIVTQDLEPVLSPHFAKGLTVNRFDAHPNELAHELAAGAMLKTLLRDFVTNEY